MAVNVPFIPARKIEEVADNFRLEFWGNDHPINPLVIWEHRLNKYIDYLPGLRDRSNVEAYISMQFDVMFLDRGSGLGSGSKRLNFSIAHELGHYRLHRDFFVSEVFPEIANQNSSAFWKMWLVESDARAYQKIETQANMFAAYLLMPSVLVHRSFHGWTHELTKREKLLSNDDFADPGFRSYFASVMAEEFDVSLSAMMNRLNELQIWPV